MKLSELLDIVKEKKYFEKIEDFSVFAEKFLEFMQNGFQADIVAQNEPDYHFFQYKTDGNYNVSRPVNSRLMLNERKFGNARKDFNYSLKHLRDLKNEIGYRENLNQYVYTCQQTIGIALDALPSNESNAARKNAGDLFERFVRLIMLSAGIDVDTGIVKIPVKNGDDILCEMAYQHDLVVKDRDEIKAIGSVKTTSKDRLDKIFIDKHLYNRLTNSQTPHFAIFLNDVQRKGVAPKYGVNATFKSGHFKGYTIKLTPLDGVYYCDLRPNMKSDVLLKKYIKPFDYFMFEDVWKF